MKKRNMMIFTLGFILLFLSGCSDSPEKYNLSLYNEDSSVYDVMEGLDKEEVELPVLSQEGMFFVGWDDGNDYYYDSYVVTGDVVLTATFESIEGIFEYEYYEETDVLVLTGYSGLSTHVVIPEMFDGQYLNRISRGAFKDSDIVYVDIPMNVSSIDSYAFENASDLEEVSFYGAPHGELIRYGLPEFLYNEDLELYGSSCVVVDVDDLTTYYQEGCPIVSAVQNPPVVVGDETYYSYDITYDLSLAPEKHTQRIHPFAFKNATSLKTIELPVGLSSLAYFTEAFDGVESLETIILDDSNPYYSLVDGVLYNKDLTRLIYYPNGLTNTTFTIPDSVTTIASQAFYQNDVLTEIYIGENVGELRQGFFDLSALERFVVDENHPTYYTVDGVLFRDIDGYITLLAYPGGKTDTSYTIPETTTYIDVYAFAYNHYLTEVIINQSLNTIFSAAFEGVSSMDTLVIPASVKTVVPNVILDSQIDTVIITGDTETILEDRHSFRTVYSDEFPGGYDYANVYIDDEIYDDYILYNNLGTMPFYFKLSEYEEE